MIISTTTLEVSRTNLRSSRFVHSSIDGDAEAALGRAVLAIDHFALTANNITYAAYGEEMSYWSFFPAEEGFGRIPVWGFAEVVASPHPDLPVGERVFGYFPMASHLVVEPVKISPARFIDGAAHRRGLPSAYNAYQRVTSDAAYSRLREPAQMILRPLVITSFLISDFLEDNSLFGAQQVLVSSASSKTSLGLGFCLKKMGLSGVATTGLTSASNRVFVEGVGVFDQVVGYDQIDSLDPKVTTVYVDMAGSVDLLTRVHGHFADKLVYSCRVGATHWEGKAGRLDLPGARPKFFFAPAQIEKRLADWGPGGLEQRFGGVWSAMVEAADHWLRVTNRSGEDAVESAYRETLEGRVAPSEGLVLSLTR
ncbi:MAG: DUF2855 family protein [Alphaproteobacteria bacterium]